MLKQTAVNTCRILLALVFIFSGFVKAIDPMGTVYKLQDYFAATPVDVTSVPMWILIGCAVALSTIEFSLGIFLLFGIHKRLTTRTTLLFMVIMTAITVWIFIKNPVKDCGCFGDAIVLNNGQTLLKNIVLLSCAVIVAVWKDKIVRFITKESQWIVENYTVIFIILISSWCIYDLPLFDFRPYRIGADFRQDMEIPEGEEQPQFETTFLMEKDGKVKEFTIDNYPDSTWTFVDSKTVQTSKGYVPPMHDFSVEDPNTGDDITEKTVKSDGFTFLLIAPDLASANDGSFGDIERIYEYSIDNKYPFYCLTASDKEAQDIWREKTGAEYNFFFADHTTLKTVTRSNPGLLLLKDGQIIGKWSNNFLPKDEDLEALTKKANQERTVKQSYTRRAILAILWFIVPLFILTIADRIWAWSRCLKRITRIKEWKRKMKKQKQENNENT